MTSIEQLTGQRFELEDLAGRFARHFARVFERRLTGPMAADTRAAGSRSSVSAQAIGRGYGS
jgi:hypothetical protein